MFRIVMHLCLLLFTVEITLGHLVTSIVTVFATSSTTTACTELSPISNRMQWAQQCAMAASNIGPIGGFQTAITTCSGSDCTTETARSTAEQVSSTDSSGGASTTEEKHRSSSTVNSATTSATASPSFGSLPANGNHKSGSSNTGVVVGAICGAIGVVALLAGLAWRTRGKWLHHLRSSTREDTVENEKYWWNNRSFRRPDENQEIHYFPSDTPKELNGSPTAPDSVDDLASGRGDGYRRRYTLMNPDPPSASSGTDRSCQDSAPRSVYEESIRSVDSNRELEADTMSPILSTAFQADAVAVDRPSPMSLPAALTPGIPYTAWSPAFAETRSRL